MGKRFSMKKVSPSAYKAIDGLDKYVAASAVPILLQELIRIRASQINGCAYCVHEHTHDALKAGASQEKINLVAVWKEAHNVFSDEERLVLLMTEEVTLISKHGLSDEVYKHAIKLFGEEATAQTLMTILAINVWNRIGVGLKMEPDLTEAK